MKIGNVVKTGEVFVKQQTHITANTKRFKQIECKRTTVFSCTCADCTFFRETRKETVAQYISLFQRDSLGDHVLHDDREITLISDVVTKSSSLLEKRLDLGFGCRLWPSENLDRTFSPKG